MSLELYIMRGVSGSGKSTRAKEIIQNALSNGKQAIVCSADDYFVNRKSGEYEFDAKKLSAAHSYCHTRADTAMYLGVDCVVIDNTNTRHWEYERYVELAEEHDYNVNVETVGQLDESNLKVYANRNRHGVSLDMIRTQAKRFQK